MSAASRLWRRAPLWRLTVFASAGAAALAALYPSPMLASLLARARLGHAPPPPADRQAVLAPPFEPVFRDRVPLAGRSLALPPGEWHQVLAGRITELEELNLLALARVENGSLTGFVFAVGSVSPPPIGRPFALDRDCDSPANYATSPPGPDAAAASASAGGTGTQTCWFVRRTDLDPGTAEGAIALQAEPAQADALRRLVSLGVTVPPLRVLATWERIEPNDVQRATTYLPGPPAPDDDALAAAAAWMRGPGHLAFGRAYDGAPDAPADPARAPRRGRAAHAAPG